MSWVFNSKLVFLSCLDGIDRWERETGNTRGLRVIQRTKNIDIKEETNHSGNNFKTKRGMGVSLHLRSRISWKKK